MTIAVGQIPVARSRWAVIWAISTISFFIVGVGAIAVGLFLNPLMVEFGWPNGTTSGFATVYSLSALLCGPAIGWVIDKVGDRLVMAWGVGAAGAGFFWLSRCHTLQEFYGPFVLIGIGYGGAFFIAATTLIAKRMGEQKNVGMGLMAGLGSVGAAVFSITIGWSIAGYGWRTTSAAAALLTATMIPAIFFFIPGDRECDANGSEELAEGTSRLPPLKLIVAPYFLLVTAASAFAAFGMSGVYYHVVSIFLKAGFSGKLASAVFGASWILSGIGSLCSGAVANRLGTKNVLAGSLLLGATGTLALAFVARAQLGMMSAGIFVVLWGATANAVTQFLPILLVERFGSAHLGALIGVQSALMGLAGSFAPMVTGTLYDAYASYQIAILACTVATVIACALVVGCGGIPGSARFTRIGR